MAFAINTRDVPRIRSYTDCQHMTQFHKPWRGTEEYPLCGRNKRHMNLRQLADGSYACRLYNTDVVIYHPDGEVTVEPWPSMSTNAFARELLPHGIYPDFCSRLGYLLRCGNTFYNLPGGGARFRNNMGRWEPVTRTEPITITKLDRKAAREACREHRLGNFLMWQRAALSLKPREHWERSSAYTSQIVQLLDDQSQWVKLRTTSESTIRYAIYRREQCFDQTEVPHIEAQEIAAVLRQDRLYN